MNLKKHVLIRFRNSSGKMITIYDTDERCHVDKVYNNYNVKDDLRMMLNTIEDVRGKKKERRRICETFVPRRTVPQVS